MSIGEKIDLVQAILSFAVLIVYALTLRVLAGQTSLAKDQTKVLVEQLQLARAGAQTATVRADHELQARIFEAYAEIDREIVATHQEESWLDLLRRFREETDSSEADSVDPFRIEAVKCAYFLNKLGLIFHTVHALSNEKVRADEYRGLRRTFEIYVPAMISVSLWERWRGAYDDQFQGFVDEYVRPGGVGEESVSASDGG